MLILDDNRLTRPVPWQLGNVYSLQALQLSFNFLTGEISNGICNLKNLETLTADCSEMDCWCCTECSPLDTTTTPGPTEAPSESSTQSPTNEPTVSPTAGPTTQSPTNKPTASPTAAPTTQSPTNEPTASPTTAPTTCKDKIEVVQDCVAQGEDIVINFLNCNPRDDDWIGLYPDWIDSQNLFYAHLWSWTCGDQNCRGRTTRGPMTLNEGNVGEPNIDVWPLEPYDYKVYLICGNPGGGPYSGYAESATFKVKKNQNYC